MYACMHGCIYNIYIYIYVCDSSSYGYTNRQTGLTRFYPGFVGSTGCKAAGGLESESGLRGFGGGVLHSTRKRTHPPPPPRSAENRRFYQGSYKTYKTEHGWMDGTQGTAAKGCLPLRRLREPPQASSATLQQRFEVPDWPPHASIHELPSARTDAEAHRPDGSGSSNCMRAQGPVVSPRILHSNPALYRQRPGISLPMPRVSAHNSMGCEDKPAWQHCASRLWKQPVQDRAYSASYQELLKQGELPRSLSQGPPISPPGARMGHQSSRSRETSLLRTSKASFFVCFAFFVVGFIGSKVRVLGFKVPQAPKDRGSRPLPRRGLRPRK